MGSKRKQEESAPPGIVVLYTALMILLLAFFIMLNALGTTEESKVKQAYQSLMDSFGFTQGGITPFRTEPLGGSPSSLRPMNPVEEDYRQVVGLVFKRNMEKDVRLLRSKTMPTVTMGGNMLFDHGSARLKPSIKPFLDQLAAIIKDRTYPLSIYGHTDDAPWQAAGGQDNWTLSTERAVAVLKYLAQKGVDPRRLAAFGQAGYEPAVPNTSLHNRRLNNRVSLVFNSNDVSRYFLPQIEPEHKLEYRGFQFDLINPDEAQGVQ